MRTWPRTADNDPFHAASQALAEALRHRTGRPVVVSFNEFCEPDLDVGLRRAAELASDEILVAAPMLTPGGEHAKVDIPDRPRRPGLPRLRFRYAWRIPLEATAAFLTAHMRRTSLPEV